MTIDITNEYGATITYGIILMYEVDSISYIALIPVDEAESPLDADVVIYEYIGNEMEDIELYEIADEIEYNTALEAFYEILDSV